MKSPLHFLLPLLAASACLAKDALPAPAAADAAQPAPAHATAYDPKRLPKGHEYFVLRDGLGNCRAKFETQKTGRVAFLGGSITQMSGWREMVARYLEQKFPGTKFEFIHAGIGSLGSVPHAFRLERDVLSHGPVDLLFVEAAVNDASNIPNEPDQMLRGMEGIVRHARTVNPLTDIVQMHFVMPEFMADYSRGKTPVVIEQHEKVAAAYGNPSLNLAQEVTDRIDAKEFTWREDFKNLHPSPFGQELYANSITRMLDAAFAQPAATAAKPHAQPSHPVDSQSYVRGRFGPVSDAHIMKGFTLDPQWKPTDGKGSRPGFVNVPALVATEAGSEFEYACDGTVAGLFIASGPDAGTVEFSVDGGPFRQVNTFTRWSQSLHLPWALILDDSLKPGHHTVRVRIAPDPQTGRTALRVFQLLLN